MNWRGITQGSLNSRLLAAGLLSVPLGLVTARAEQAKVHLLMHDSAAANAAQFRTSVRMTSAWHDMVTFAVLLGVLTLCVEGLAYLIRRSTRPAEPPGPSA